MLASNRSTRTCRTRKRGRSYTLCRFYLHVLITIQHVHGCDQGIDERQIVRDTRHVTFSRHDTVSSCNRTPLLKRYNISVVGLLIGAPLAPLRRLAGLGVIAARRIGSLSDAREKFPTGVARPARTDGSVAADQSIRDRRPGVGFLPVRRLTARRIRSLSTTARQRSLWIGLPRYILSLFYLMLASR